MKRIVSLLACLVPLSLISQVNFIDNTVITTEKIPFNTPASDFGPSFVEKEFWFSAFADEKIEQFKQGDSKNLFYKLFAIPLDEDGNLLQGKTLMLDEINAGYHAGPVSFCNYTKELFVTLSNHENAEIKNTVFQIKNIPLKIISLKRAENSWVKVQDLPFNHHSYSVGHPAVSVTGDTLIFASNITDKGMGNTDLYMTIRENGQWREMINLGKKINSSSDDMFPYLHAGKILFYASNGKEGGKGGFDIWYSILSETGFTEPVNVAALNSTSDDFGLVVHPNEGTGYYVSNKNDENDNDDNIFKVIFKGGYELELAVKDKKTQMPIPDAKVEFSDNKKLYTNIGGIIHRSLEKSTDYTAKTSIDGYMNLSVNISTKNQPFGIVQKELLLEKAEVGQKYVLNNIYYQFDKWNILPESEPELDKLVNILKDNPSWKIELASHTDCRGTDNYNDILSQKRSDSARQYIAGKGILNNRIIAKGYGERQLINQCNDGEPCSEELHRLNRRTEFEILEMEQQSHDMR